MRTEQRPHICLFSQTGSEIADLIQQSGLKVDLILTNYRPAHTRVIDARIVDRVVYLSNNPTAEEYRHYFDKFKDPIITLHGWLRIVPGEVCSDYEIYNGHPGLILEDEYPELKGKDPQQKAYDLKLPYSGCVIHQVTSEVDEGHVILSKRVFIDKLSLSEIFLKLRECSLELWTIFLNREWKNG